MPKGGELHFFFFLSTLLKPKKEANNLQHPITNIIMAKQNRECICTSKLKLDVSIDGLGISCPSCIVSV